MLIAFLISAAGQAQTLSIDGHDPYFHLKVKLHDTGGRGHFLPPEIKLVDFQFVYTPSGSTHSPRELFYVDVFGRSLTTITADDVELVEFGRGVNSPEPDVTGYYLYVRLKPSARRLIRGYKYLGVGLGSFGQPRAPHHLLLLNDDADNAAGAFKPSLWHRRYVGDQIFLKPLLACEGRLL